MDMQGCNEGPAQCMPLAMKSLCVKKGKESQNKSAAISVKHGESLVDAGMM